MPQAHAKLSASGSAQWLNCTGSIRMARDYPNESSPFAAEGTAAHALGEHCLNHNIISVSSFLDHVIYNEAVFHPSYASENDLESDTYHTVDEEMVESIQEYVDIVRSYTGLLLVERRVDFSEWVHEGFGTADAIVVQDGTVNVIDLKYGKGVRVDAYWNSQAMLYMLGVYAEYGLLYELHTFKAVIVQPRLDHISEFEISREDLIAWAEKQVRPKALEALAEDAPLTAGEKQCRWCRAKGDCAVLAKWSLEQAMEGFEFIKPDMKPKNTDRLTPDQIATLLPQLKTITQWSHAVEASALVRITGGEIVTGYKRVRTHTNRKWADEKQAEAVLAKKLKKGERTTTKLISPAQAEKLLGKANPILNDIVVRPEGKPTVVPEYDKRPAIEDAMAGFEFEQQEN